MFASWSAIPSKTKKKNLIYEHKNLYNIIIYPFLCKSSKFTIFFIYDIQSSFNFIASAYDKTSLGGRHNPSIRFNWFFGLYLSTGFGFFLGV